MALIKLTDSEKKEMIEIISDVLKGSENGRETITHIISHINDAGFRVGNYYEFECELEEMGFKLEFSYNNSGCVTRTFVTMGE
jgi:hypothetical protein